MVLPALQPLAERTPLVEPSAPPSLPDQAGPTRGQFIPAIAADDTRSGDIFLRAASILGRTNRQNGLPRADSYQFADSADGRWFSVVVTGGVAGTGFSHLGATLAAHNARVLLTESGELSVKDLTEIPGQVDALLAEQFAGHEAQIMTDMTFLAFDRSNEMCYASRVGSGDVLLPLNNLWRSVFPEADEATTSALLPGGGAKVQRARFPFSQGATAVIGTRGSTGAMSGEPNEVGAAFWNALTEPTPLDVYLPLVNFDRDGYDDDRTLVTLWRRAIDST